MIGFSSGVGAAARMQAADAGMRELQAKVEAYRMLAGHYPTTSQGLEALVVEPTTDPLPRLWKQQFPAVPVDPMGPDGIAGTSDDR